MFFLLHDQSHGELSPVTRRSPVTDGLALTHDGVSLGLHEETEDTETQSLNPQNNCAKILNKLCVQTCPWGLVLF